MRLVVGKKINLATAKVRIELPQLCTTMRHITTIIVPVILTDLLVKEYRGENQTVRHEDSHLV